ncbi:unnamed protein product [Knipowitschia caucasica]
MFSFRLQRSLPVCAAAATSALHTGSSRALPGLLLLSRAPPGLRPQLRFRYNRAEEEAQRRNRNRTVLTYIAAAGVGMIGLSYAAVPLYRLYCQVSPPEFIQTAVPRSGPKVLGSIMMIV